MSVVVAACAASACSDPVAHDEPSAATGDGGVEMRLLQTQTERDPAALAGTTRALEGAPVRPAPASSAPALMAPSGTACRLEHPPGDCDRCPDRACLQVRLSVDLPPQDSLWVSFCDQGDVREEALIACLCAGGAAIACERAAQDTALALSIVDHVFGGDVPAIGTRYRDSSGLRAVVDETMHVWLASSASAPATIRCDAPDREAVEALYRTRSQAVRITGVCSE